VRIAQMIATVRKDVAPQKVVIAREYNHSPKMISVTRRK
jgi:hypothetical protein